MLESYQKKFIAYNKKIWGKKRKSNKRFFLVEGMLGAMPAHLIRLGIVLNAVADTVDENPLVILNSCTDDRNKEMFKSFGVSDFIFLDEIRLNLIEKIKAVFKVFPCVIFKNINKVLLLEYKGMNFGHLVYDDLLRSNKGSYTVGKVDKKCILTIYKAICYIFKYSKIISRYKTEIVVVTHNEYVEFGTLGIAAIAQDNAILNINDFELSINKDKNGLYLHERFRKGLKEEITKGDKEELLKEGRRLLQARVCAGTGVYDFKNAYLNKKTYTRDELAERFSHNAKKNIFIFMHVFSDAPHLSKMTMYKDYYEWISDTMEQITHICDVNWYIKVHPSAFLYGESNAFEKVMKNGKGNIFWTPDDFNTFSIKDVADAVITCQGTVGIEASCMGIPVIITGRPYYSNLGFTIEPRSKKEYYTILKKVYKIKRLSLEKTKKAQIALGAYGKYNFMEDTILDNEVYNYAGYGKQTDYERAYNRIIENMQGKLCSDIPLYDKTKELLKQNLREYINL